MTWTQLRGVLAVVLVSLSAAPLAYGKGDPVENEAMRELQARFSSTMNGSGGRQATPAAVPDIFGPGAVLTSGQVHMKITNFGVLGNPFTNISTDASAQWPGASGVEYLNFIILTVGAVNPTATDPSAIRRASFINEWWPPTPDPEDRMYRAYDGIINGARLGNDDGDFNPFTGEPNIDEDFLDGRDNDGDNRIDEDFAAVGQLMFSCVMRDDTPAALAVVGNERHVPLGVELRQLAWCYSVPGFTNFNAIELTAINRSGHTLDSLYFGLRSDIDSGPLTSSTYFSDDFDLPQFPSGEFTQPVAIDDPRYQLDPDTGVPACPEVKVRVHGFSVVDNDGDEGRTPGVASILLFGHTLDPLGLRGPSRVGFRSFRSFIAGTPYASNGNPATDQQRFELMASAQNIDPETGFINAEAGDQAGDYTGWANVGPFLNIPDGGSVQVTFGLAVETGAYADLLNYPADYVRYQAGLISLSDLFDKYPALENAFSAQVAYEGVYEPARPGFQELVPNCIGCETGLKLPKGTTPTLFVENCPDREAIQKLVTDNAYTWFDFDCDVCTGVFDRATRQGFYLRHWNAESPPPSPNMNVASTYNYTDNPDRVSPAGDGYITLAWDNIAENTADPKSAAFDFRSYRIWKVAGWRRPVGSSGPNDEDWALLSELRLFDYEDRNYTTPDACPRVFVPSFEYPAGSAHCADIADWLRAGVPTSGTLLGNGGCRDTATVGICLNRGDFWDRQTGFVLRPDPSVDCVREEGECVVDSARALGEDINLGRTRYKVGRYAYVDREVKNGFTYFYSITAGDSTGGGELFGRRSAVEADAVTPQAATSQTKNVWVVPNPYRGTRSLADRSSGWDLTPNATDPTGTHVDFMGMPPGPWTLRIFTVSGDLVAELHDGDSINESVRSSVIGGDGVTRPGFNRQQDTPTDGQARWNLISRNGQDVVSGIYLFVVESGIGQQRGKFVIVR